MNEEKKKGRGRPKGSVKFGGRTAGTPNKAVQFTRDCFQEILDMYVSPDENNEENMSRIKQDFLALPPYQRLYVADKFAQYIFPKKQDISANVKPGGRSIEEDIAAILAADK